MFFVWMLEAVLEWMYYWLKNYKVYEEGRRGEGWVRKWNDAKWWENDAKMKDHCHCYPNLKFLKSDIYWVLIVIISVSN